MASPLGSSAQVKPWRYYVIAQGGAVCKGYDTLPGAETAALAFGDRTWVVDTLAGAYTPALYRVCAGALVVEGAGLFDHRLGLEANLVEAVARRSPPLVLALLAKGADANGRDRRGRTALNFAVSRGEAALVSALLAAGADPHACDGRGVSARQLAEDRGADHLVALMSE